MSITHKQSLSVTPTSSGSVSGTITEVGANEVVIDDAVAASQTNLLRAVSFTQSLVQSIIMLASTDLTVKTNSSGSPTDTISLKAGIPLIWSKSSAYFTCPFSANVTAFYLTNSTVPTTFKVRILTT